MYRAKNLFGPSKVPAVVPPSLFHQFEVVLIPAFVVPIVDR